MIWSHLGSSRVISGHLGSSQDISGPLGQSSRVISEASDAPPRRRVDSPSLPAALAPPARAPTSRRRRAPRGAPTEQRKVPTKRKMSRRPKPRVECSKHGSQGAAVLLDKGERPSENRERAAAAAAPPRRRPATARAAAAARLHVHVHDHMPLRRHRLRRRRRRPPTAPSPPPPRRALSSRPVRAGCRPVRARVFGDSKCVCGQTRHNLLRARLRVYDAAV